MVGAGALVANRALTDCSERQQTTGVMVRKDAAQPTGDEAESFRSKASNVGEGARSLGGAMRQMQKGRHAGSAAVTGDALNLAAPQPTDSLKKATEQIVPLFNSMYSRATRPSKEPADTRAPRAPRTMGDAMRRQSREPREPREPTQAAAPGSTPSCALDITDQVPIVHQVPSAPPSPRPVPAASSSPPGKADDVELPQDASAQLRWRPLQAWSQHVYCNRPGSC